MRALKNKWLERTDSGVLEEPKKKEELTGTIMDFKARPKAHLEILLESVLGYICTDRVYF